MAKMLGQNSRSFGRLKSFKFMRGINIDQNFIDKITKKELLRFMHINGYDEREVFYAENINSKTLEEILDINFRLSKYITEHTKDLRGIVEIHPTSDYTTKSAHIHYWGEKSKEVAPIISKFIRDNFLTNKLHYDKLDIPFIGSDQNDELLMEENNDEDELKIVNIDLELIKKEHKEWFDISKHRVDKLKKRVQLLKKRV